MGVARDEGLPSQAKPSQTSSPGDWRAGPFPEHRRQIMGRAPLDLERIREGVYRTIGDVRAVYLRRQSQRGWVVYAPDRQPLAAGTFAAATRLARELVEEIRAEKTHT